MRPAAFHFEGNSVFDEKTLAALLANRVDRPTDLAGLIEAASAVSQYYRTQGYLLTEAYLPEQAFQAAGGTVTIAVIEARVGRVQVQIDGESGSASYARRVVHANLQSGALISEYLLDKPVLLLRDLAGVHATATVEPGQKPGQADVTVTVRSQGLAVDGSVGMDNFGARAAGPLHVSGNLNVGNLLGTGDVFSARAQLSDASRSQLYRLAYALPVDTSGTRLTLSAARTDYALGEPFTALGATGQAEVLGLALTRPLIRAREANVYGLLDLEDKKFSDQLTTPVNESDRRIVAARVGLLGNFTDELAGSGAASSYAVTGTLGRTRLDALSLGFDQGPGGFRTAGGFGKLNLEFQRAQFFNNPSSIHMNLQAQMASRNLASAEKMALGGPNGVRSYPVGEGIGDAGLLFNFEYRYQLSALVALAGERVSLAVFYDYGTVRVNQDDSALPGGTNRVSLGAVGVGALAGRVNNFLITTYLAWRTTRSTPFTGEPDRSPRAWVSAQKWF
ncbi:ShlB/FhaC/HecB family hemolysin secretion/activation protein [Polaromonas sp.]|uniref:ShlB/FhaC/HecB family hemolysin secretion/activation protein n=1 Tax=Polaromonas sp. TaxID=1869339 RepID=UPI003264AC24